MQRILIIRFSSIGDIVLTTPVVRVLRKKYPAADIRFVTKKQYAGLMQPNTYLNGVFLLNESLNTLASELKAFKPDLVIDLHHNLRTRILKTLIGGKWLAFHKLNVEKWLKVNLKVDRLPNVHIVQRYLETLKPLGIEDDGKGLEFFFPPELTMNQGASSSPKKSDYPPVGKQTIPPLKGGEQHSDQTSLQTADKRTSSSPEKGRWPEVGGVMNLPQLKFFRQELRKNLTSAEAKLWTSLKGKQLDGRKFRRQHSIGGYILDFYCPSENLAIELDGEVHNQANVIDYDVERTLFIEQFGVKVLRFENKLVFDQNEDVLEEIKRNFGWRENHPVPSGHPSFSGGEQHSDQTSLQTADKRTSSSPEKGRWPEAGGVISETKRDSVLPEGFTGKYVALVIGAKFKTKQLPVAKLVELCNGLKRPIVLIGGKEDAEVADEVLKQSTAQIYNACGTHSLAASAWLVKQAEAVITHDTGMMHISAAFNKKIISVWGNTIPQFGMYPYLPESEPAYLSEVKELNCRPCSKIGYNACPKGHFKCMNEQDISVIIEQTNQLLSQ